MLALDVLFIDEIGTLSNQQLAVLDEHPYTMAGLQTSLTNTFNEFWGDKTCKQLQSIYKDFQDSPDIPIREEVERVTRFSHCHRDPMQSSNQFDGQSNESYDEQLFATKVFISAIDKYISIPGIQSSFTMTHTKGVIIHGGPGMGKTHVAKLAVFYALFSIERSQDNIFFHSWCPRILS